MAKYSDLIFYNMNLVQALNHWSVRGGESRISGSRIILAPGGTAEISLDTAFVSSALVKAKYKRIIIQTETSQAVSGNTSFVCGLNNTGVRATLTSEYNTNVQNITEKIALELNPVMASVSGYANYYDFVVETPNYDLVSSSIIIENFSTSSITITAAQIFRSQDTSQLGEGTNVTLKLTSLKAYYDGLEIGFSDSATPIKVWWLSDADGNFSGVNVNNERLVPYSKIEGTLSGNMM